MNDFKYMTKLTIRNSILLRRHAYISLKGPVQIPFRIPDHLCNFHHTQIGILQRLLRLLHLIFSQIFNKRNANLLFEHTAQIRRTHPDHLGTFDQGMIGTGIFADMLAYFLDGDFDTFLRNSSVSC